MDYFLLVILWICWCTLHSLFISRTVTTLMKARLAESFVYYRLGYNLFALATLLPLLLFGRSFDSVVVLHWSGPAVILQATLLLSALFFFCAGAMRYDMGQFLGISQIRWGKAHSILTQSGRLDTGGILRVTRHPWYIGGVFLLWSYQVQLDLQSLLTNLVLTFYLLVGALLEERKLVAQFGDEYRKYSQEVSMLFPLKWLLRHVQKR